jgi:hypothetical protein
MLQAPRRRIVNKAALIQRVGRDSESVGIRTVESREAWAISSSLHSTLVIALMMVDTNVRRHSGRK